MYQVHLWEGIQPARLVRIFGEQPLLQDPDEQPLKYRVSVSEEQQEFSQ